MLEATPLSGRRRDSQDLLATVRDESRCAKDERRELGRKTIRIIRIPGSFTSHQRVSFYKTEGDIAA